MLITICFLLELIFYLIFYYIIMSKKCKWQEENIELDIKEVNDSLSSNSSALKEKGSDV